MLRAVAALNKRIDDTQGAVEHHGRRVGLPQRFQQQRSTLRSTNQMPIMRVLPAGPCGLTAFLNVRQRHIRHTQVQQIRHLIFIALKALFAQHFVDPLAHTRVTLRRLDSRPFGDV